MTVSIRAELSKNEGLINDNNWMLEQCDSQSLRLTETAKEIKMLQDDCQKRIFVSCFGISQELREYEENSDGELEPSLNDLENAELLWVNLFQSIINKTEKVLMQITELISNTVQLNECLKIQLNYLYQEKGGILQR